MEQSRMNTSRSSNCEGHPLASEDTPPPKRERIFSVDVLRGFDMFWIIGGAGFVLALARLVGGPLQTVFERQLEHVEWEGFVFYDLIFPLFVFIIGMSVVFSLQRILASDGKKGAYRRLLRRFAILYLLGFLYYGGMEKGFENIRLIGVLQRLAFAYLFTGMLFIHFRLRGMLVAFFILLLGYWAWLSFVPVPGLGHTSFARGENWTNWFDARFLPLRKYFGAYESQGILSTIPTVGSGLLGVFASLLLLNRAIEARKKVLYFIGGGAVMVIAGYLWGLQFPIIKNIWTSSYVLVAGGYSFVLLGAFYLILDVWRIRWWATPFIWIGVNPIFIYLAVSVVNFNDLATRFVGGEIAAIGGEALGGFLLASVSLALRLLLVRFLYQRKIFITI
jgi:predicted acyltransferase